MALGSDACRFLIFIMYLILDSIPARYYHVHGAGDPGLVDACLVVAESRRDG